MKRLCNECVGSLACGHRIAGPCSASYATCMRLSSLLKRNNVLCWVLQERHAAAEAARFDRAFYHNSKRFEKDERQVIGVVAASCQTLLMFHEQVYVITAAHCELEVTSSPVSPAVSAPSVLTCGVSLVLQKQKKEEHDKSGFMCEHGVWRCRICQPVTKHK